MKIKNFSLVKKHYTLFKWIGIIIKSSSAILCLFFIFYLMIFLGIFGKIPSYKELKKIRFATGSEVYSKDSVLLGVYTKLDRADITYDEISPYAVNALVATEDARFFNHNGIDLNSACRVVLKSILFGDESAGGGSTLSQQLAKNLYPRESFMIGSMPINKIREMIISKRIEKTYSKKEIIELYFNVVPMSGNIYGIQRAAKRFFNKEAKDLSIEESALLVGMLKATTIYNPKKDLAKSLERRNTVINQMVKYRFVNSITADSIKLLPVKLNINNKDLNKKGIAPYLVAYLRPQLEDWCLQNADADGEAYDLYLDGLKIYTTIDSRLQESANKSFATVLPYLQKSFDKNHTIDNYKSLIKFGVEKSRRYKLLIDKGYNQKEIHKNFNKSVAMSIVTNSGIIKRNMTPLDSVIYHQKRLQAGMIAMHPNTGEVKAWIGGSNFKTSEFDYVISERQTGSTFKPILYASAIENGHQPCQYYDNKLESYASYNNWTPKNSDNKYGGMYSMKGALTNSVNTVSAQIMMQTGVDNVIGTAKRMLINAELPRYPSLSLGVGSISLLDMVKAYSSFANKGIPSEPIFIKSIYNNKGQLIRQEDLPPFHENAISERTAALVLNMMKNVVTEGTASKLKNQYHIDVEIAGKTGTSQRQRDGWFIGITPDLVTGVWVGAESPMVHFNNLQDGQGSATALPIFATFMKNAISKKIIFKKSFSSDVNRWNNELECSTFIEEVPLFGNDSLMTYDYMADANNDYNSTYSEVVTESKSNYESFTRSDTISNQRRKNNRTSHSPNLVDKTSVSTQQSKQNEETVPVVKTVQKSESAEKSESQAEVIQK